MAQVAFKNIRSETAAPRSSAANVGKLPFLEASPQKSVAALMAPGRRRAFLVDADVTQRSAADAEFRGALCRADILLPDGPAPSGHGRIDGRHAGTAPSGSSRFDSRPAGTALMPLLLALAGLRGKSVFLLGGTAGTAEAAAMGMMMQAHGLRVAGTLGGRIAELAPEPVCDRINASGAAILLVSMRSPEQELWIDRHGHRIDAELQMGVGSVFDTYARNVLRSPRLLSVWSA